MSENTVRDLSDVAETLLIPLYMRAMESQRPDALIKDVKAVALVQQMNYDFSRFKFEDHDQVAIVLRTREFDRHTRDFLARNSRPTPAGRPRTAGQPRPTPAGRPRTAGQPQAVVVHIGCGLDARLERVAERNSLVEWYDLDLPPVIELRRKLIGDEGAHHHLLDSSVFDAAWLEALSAQRQRPFLFLAEGFLMYFEEAQVKALVRTLREHFPGAELVCDAWSPLLVWMNNRRKAGCGVSARYQWGLKRPEDIESWGDGIRLLDKWYLLDRPLPRLAASHQWMRHFPPLAKSSGIFHYQLGQPKE